MFISLVSLLLVYGLHISVVRAGQLAKEGQGSLIGYPGTIYTAHKYRPICGTLSHSAYKGEYDMGEACRSAIYQYRLSNDTWSVYDTLGVRLSDTTPLGAGAALCMCFSLFDLDTTSANMCIYVTDEGTTTETVPFLGVPIAVGSYRLGNKALPACFEVDSEAVISSLDAAGDATRVQIQPSPTTSAHLTSTVSTTSTFSSSTSIISQTITSQGDSSIISPLIPNPTATTPGGNSPSQTRTSRTGPGGLYVWLPILLILFGATIIDYLRKRHQLDKAKYKIQQLQAENDLLKDNKVDRNTTIASPLPSYSRASDWP
ncbi:hypothetical protein CPB86DRAFT_790163 [Serendipita vermifera]|nr:hypothetical protein CPB86DRAFT_790163 [Serendipita vermifera]